MFRGEVRVIVKKPLSCPFSVELAAAQQITLRHGVGLDIFHYFTINGTDQPQWAMLSTDHPLLGLALQRPGTLTFTLEDVPTRVFFGPPGDGRNLETVPVTKLVLQDQQFTLEEITANINFKTEWYFNLIPFLQQECK